MHVFPIEVFLIQFPDCSSKALLSISHETSLKDDHIEITAVYLCNVIAWGCYCGNTSSMMPAVCVL